MCKRDFISASSAVGLGALIGGLLSIEIATRFSLGGFLWIFGALIGGCVAYVTADFRHFCDGVSDAYNKTVSWRPNCLYWKTVAIYFAGTSLAWFSFFFSLFVFLCFVDDMMNKLPYFVWVSVPMSALLGTIITKVNTQRTGWMVGRRYTCHMLEVQKSGYYLLTRYNPVSAPFVVFFYIIRVVYLMVKAMPEFRIWAVKASRVLRSFLLVALKNVHSQKRAVVFFDATAGAVIGYMLGSALLGACIGAIAIYPLHRELIAVRLLKVMPR